MHRSMPEGYRRRRSRLPQKLHTEKFELRNPSQRATSIKNNQIKSDPLLTLPHVLLSVLCSICQLLRVVLCVVYCVIGFVVLTCIKSVCSKTSNSWISKWSSKNISNHKSRGSAKTSDRGIPFFKAGKSTKSKTKLSSNLARSMGQSKGPNRAISPIRAIRSFFRSMTFLWIRS
jgi:hypothetical protein